MKPKEMTVTLKGADRLDFRISFIIAEFDGQKHLTFV